MKEGTKIVNTSLLAIAAMLMMAAAAHAAATPAQKCEAGKNGTAGKYAACLHKTQQKFVSGGEVDTAGRDAAILSCGTKYADKFQSYEDKAGMGVCPSEGDVAGIRSFLDACIFSAEDALGGGTLLSDVVTCNSDLTSCEGDLGTCQVDLAASEAIPKGQAHKTGQTTCYDVGGSVVPCAGTGQDGDVQKGIVNAFTDNGDGTTTDNQTGLMWEKLDDSNLPGLVGIHDKDRFYTWADAFVKISDLNASAFAGHTDWRVPSVKELQTLVSFGAVEPSTFASFNTACAPGCTVTTCSCTQSNYYWSSSTFQFVPDYAWIVDFSFGYTVGYDKTVDGYVRAVRAGS